MVKPQTFHVGITEKDRTLSMDLLRLVDTRMLIQANSGGGKSWLLRLIAERVAGKVQLILLDPEGEFATLREKIDIALVGQGGEMTTDVRSAALLARKLVELRVSAVVDLYDLKLGDRRKYVRLFLESLMNVPRAQWHPLLVILDEAHLFAPEKSAGEAESTSAVIALMSQGRKRGFAGLLSTQRLSKLHKDAAAESNNVIIGRTWLDVDQQRAGDLLGMNKADRQTLRDLAPGEFYAFGPALHVNGVVRFRSDAVSTTHPKAGERHTLEVPQASHAIQEIVKQIGDLPQQAEAETRSINEAQRKIADLERQLRSRPVQVQAKVETRVEQVRVPVLNGELPRLEEAIRQLTAAGEQLAVVGNQIANVGNQVATVGGQVVSSAREVSAAILKFQTTPRLRTPSMQPTAKPVRPVATKLAIQSVPLSTIHDSDVTKPQQDILDALATLEALGIKQTAKVNVAALCGKSAKSSTYTNNLGALRSRGWIEYPSSNYLALTDEGHTHAAPRFEIHSASDLHTAWYAVLDRPKAAILQVLIEAYPDSLSKEELAERAAQYYGKSISATSSSYTNNLGALRSLGIIAYPQSGLVMATELLFPEGL